MVPSEPRVVFWYRLYCGAMVLLYLACIAGGVAMVVFRDSLVDADMSSTEAGITGVVLAGVGLGLAAAFTAAFFLPRRRWAWTYHLVLIALGLTSCCCMPVTVPLLIFWIRADTQAYFAEES
jgi:hypothetical protein